MRYIVKLIITALFLFSKLSSPYSFHENLAVSSSLHLYPKYLEEKYSFEGKKLDVSEMEIQEELNK